MTTTVTEAPRSLQKASQSLSEESKRVMQAALAHTYFKSRITVANRDENGEHRGKINVSLEEISEFDQISLNSRKVINFLVLDIDNVNWKPLVAPIQDMLAWVRPTPHGVHAVIMIDGIHTDHARSMSFYRAIAANLTVLTQADTSFSNSGTRNPFKAPEKTIWLSEKVWNMNEMKSFLEAKGLWRSGMSFAINRARKETLYVENSRNCRIYWMTADQKKKDSTIDAYNYASALNSIESNPLPESEIRSIARSIDRNWGKYRVKNRKGETVNPLLAEEGQRGGLANSPAQQAYRAKIVALSEERYGKLCVLREQGYSLEEAASMIGVSKRSAQRLMKKHDDESLKDNLSSLPSCAMVSPQDKNVSPLQKKKDHALMRRQQGWTKKEIAEELGVTMRTVQRYLNDDHQVGIERVEEEVVQTVVEASVSHSETVEEDQRVVVSKPVRKAVRRRSGKKQSWEDVSASAKVSEADMLMREQYVMSLDFESVEEAEFVKSMFELA